MPYLITSIATISLYLAGLVMSLFGPAPGRFAGMVAFFSSMILLCLLNSDHKKTHWTGIISTNPSVERYRKPLNVCMILCVVTFAAASVTMLTSGKEGVADGSRPVFAHQDEYHLNNHGDLTPVTRTRYLIVGSTFLIGWHSFGLLFALLGLHQVLYGQFPECFERESSTGN